MARRNRILILILSGLVAGSVSAQTDAPPGPRPHIPPPQLPPMDLISVPTAGLLERDTYDLELHAFHAGGVVARTRFGFTDAVMIGISYGGLGVLGQGSPRWHPRPELHLRLRVLDESFSRPAWTVGFDSQGIGDWNGEIERYEFKARGIFTVLSKSYALVEGCGVHLGISYNPLEGGEQEHRPDLFAGVDLAINPRFTWMAEYTAAFNEDDGAVIPLRHSGRGFLNTGISLEFAEGLALRFVVRDMLRRTEQADWSRELTITYRRGR